MAVAFLTPTLWDECVSCSNFMNPVGNHIFVIPKEEKEQALLTTYKPVSQECVVYLVSPDVKDIKTGQNIIVRRGKILKVNNNHILNTEHIQLVNYG